LKFREIARHALPSPQAKTPNPIAPTSRRPNGRSKTFSVCSFSLDPECEPKMIATVV
jgi:hypothetical protein